MEQQNAVTELEDDSLFTENVWVCGCVCLSAVFVLPKCQWPFSIISLSL